MRKPFAERFKIRRIQIRIDRFLMAERIMRNASVVMTGINGERIRQSAQPAHGAEHRLRRAESAFADKQSVPGKQCGIAGIPETHRIHGMSGRGKTLDKTVSKRQTFPVFQSAVTGKSGCGGNAEYSGAYTNPSFLQLHGGSAQYPRKGPRSARPVRKQQNKKS